MILDLEGRRAVVTGGGRGLGYGIAQALHDSGAEVIITGRTGKVWEAAAEIGSSGPPAYGVTGDLSRQQQRETVCEQILEIYNGRVDILVNAAGTLNRCAAFEVTQEDWNEVLELNLNAVFFMSQRIGRSMAARRYGKIINIASMDSFFGSVLVPAYSASKGGVAQLTKALSNEWAAEGINVNAIAPGYMATALTDTMKVKNPAQYEETTRRIPMGRWGTAEDLKGLAVFLASDASAYISGAVIPVDGGFLGR